MLIFIKMKKEIIQEVEIPENVEAKINGSILMIKGKEGKISINKLEILFIFTAFFLAIFAFFIIFSASATISCDIF